MSRCTLLHVVHMNVMHRVHAYRVHADIERSLRSDGTQALSPSSSLVYITTLQRTRSPLYPHPTDSMVQNKIARRAMGDSKGRTLCV